MIGQWTHQWLESQSYLSRYFETTTSTNLIAKENASNEPGPLTFYVADRQTMGRGQGNHKWLNTDPGTNLLLTYSIDCHRPPQPELCVSIGEQLKETCSLVWPELQWQLKPPNDLLLYQKKVAGILLESISQGPHHRLLLGLGFNALDFPKSHDFLATSLQSHLPQPLEQVQWNQFLSELFRRVTETCLLG